MKNKITLFLIIHLLSSCNTDLGNDFKMLIVLRNKFNINSVKITSSKNSTTLTLQDIDYNHISKDSLKKLAIKVDDFLIDKFPKVDTITQRKYVFAGAGGFNIIEFRVDKNGGISKIKEY